MEPINEKPINNIDNSDDHDQKKLQLGLDHDPDVENKARYEQNLSTRVSQITKMEPTYGKPNNGNDVNQQNLGLGVDRDRYEEDEVRNDERLSSIRVSQITKMEPNDGKSDDDDEKNLGFGFDRDPDEENKAMYEQNLSSIRVSAEKIENGDDQKNLGFGFNHDPDEEDEVRYEQNLSSIRVSENGDNQQNLGFGYDPDEEDEARYEERLSEEFEGLVLAEHRAGRRVGDDHWRNGKGYNGSFMHPVRPDAEDCPYYMKTGSCKYGPTCKFNHPFKRRGQYPKAGRDREGYSERFGQKGYLERPGQKSYSERPGQIECKFQMTPGGCKFGDACKYSHNRTKTTATPAGPVNFLGLPIRPEAMDCSFYMRSGSCKYGSNCKFNHPEPTSVPGSNSPSGYINGGPVSLPAGPQNAAPQWSQAGALNGNGSMVYSPTNAAVPDPNLEWNSYQAPVYPEKERRLPTPPAFALNNLSESNFFPHQRLPMSTDDFPERPGEPECNYYMKTGDCKYRSSCKFHHPKNRSKSTQQLILSDKGLPLRPDEVVCSYYTRYGLCKFGPACRYNHPENYDNSAPSTGSQQNHNPYFGSSGEANGGGYENDGWN